MSGERVLGRGLAALLAEAIPPAWDGDGGDLRRVPVAALRPGRLQPRVRFDEDELLLLAESLRRSGMMQPIVARPAPEDGAMLEIVAGERRWRAAQMARIHEVPVIVREMSDREVLETGLVENLQRADLGPLEEAAGYERLREEFGLNRTDVAGVVGRSRAHVANTVRLLQLPASVRVLLERGKLSAGHGRALLAAADPGGLAETVVRLGLSVRETEARARAPAGEPGRERRRTRRDDGEDADLRALRTRLAEATGLKVEIARKGEGGRLILHYSAPEQLDDAIARLERPPPRV